MSKAVETLRTLVEQYAADDAKFEDKGNASAGTRARKTLQEIKKVCSERRAEIQAAKKAA